MANLTIWSCCNIWQQRRGKSAEFVKAIVLDVQKLQHGFRVNILLYVDLIYFIIR